MQLGRLSLQLNATEDILEGGRTAEMRLGKSRETESILRSDYFDRLFSMEGELDSGSK